MIYIIEIAGSYVLEEKGPDCVNGGIDRDEKNYRTFGDRVKRCF